MLPVLLPAARKHSEHGARNVAVHPTDGFGGWDAGAPYDRIVSWTTPQVLPHSWLKQARDQAVIVTPVKVAPIANANMILRVDIQQGRPIARDVHVGGYIEMHSVVITEFPVPVRYVDGLFRSDGRVVWVSAPELRKHPALADRTVQMIAAGRAVASPFATDNGSTVGACHGHLLARRPTGLASTGVDGDWGIGLLLPDSAALLRNNVFYLAGGPAAEKQVRALVREWEQVTNGSCAFSRAT